MAGPPHPEALRLLVACPGCKRQYDATKLEAGSRFHCDCGSTIEVPRVRSKDAAVVRCSSCGAARAKTEPSCRHCGASFSVLERELHTICPKCMTRVSDRARYCHNCATALAPQKLQTAWTDRPCPACGDAHPLRSRSIGAAAVSCCECPACAGMWLSNEVFQAVLDRTGQAASFDLPAAAGKAPAAFDEQPRYRNCPHCKTLMHRRNYGRMSGVIIDSCRDHGMWFDAHELERILRWVRGGGENDVQRREREDARQSQMKTRLDQATRSWEAPADSPRIDSLGLAGSLSGALGVVFGALFDS